MSRDLSKALPQCKLTYITASANWRQTPMQSKMARVRKSDVSPLPVGDESGNSHVNERKAAVDPPRALRSTESCSLWINRSKSGRFGGRKGREHTHNSLLWFVTPNARTCPYILFHTNRPICSTQDLVCAAYWGSQPSHCRSDKGTFRSKGELLRRSETHCS